LQNGRISVAIDSELFAKYRVNPLLQKRSFTINYVLQDYIHRLINELANHIFLFSNLAYYFKNMKWERSSKVPLIRILNNTIRAIVSKNRIDNFFKFKENYLSSMK
jgi:aspartate/glutamate racemase